MLRNHLVTLLGEKDNDSVTVDVNGILIDIEAVTADRGCIVLVLNPDDISDVLRTATSQTLPTEPKSTE